MKQGVKFLLSLVLLAVLALPLASEASTLASRLSGRILLQVQAHGEAWYVYPVNLQRFYLGRPIDAFRIMTSLSLGISNSDFDSFNGVAPSRLAGRILLKVQDLGKAYYVNPVDLRMHFMGSPSDAFALMTSFGLGITTADLSHLPISGASAIPPGDVMNIVVTSPAQNEATSSPITVTGRARVFENALNIRLRDAAGKVLVDTTAMAQAPDVGQFGPFEKTITFVRPSTSTGSLEVFALSAKDGSEIDMVIVSIKFK